MREAQNHMMNEQNNVQNSLVVVQLNFDILFQVFKAFPTLLTNINKTEHRKELS